MRDIHLLYLINRYKAREGEPLLGALLGALAAEGPLERLAVRELLLHVPRDVLEDQGDRAPGDAFAAVGVQHAHAEADPVEVLS